MYDTKKHQIVKYIKLKQANWPSLLKKWHWHVFRHTHHKISVYCRCISLTLTVELSYIINATHCSPEVKNTKKKRQLHLNLGHGLWRRNRYLCLRKERATDGERKSMLILWINLFFPVCYGEGETSDHLSVGLCKQRCHGNTSCLS